MTRLQELWIGAVPIAVTAIVVAVNLGTHQPATTEHPSHLRAAHRVAPSSPSRGKESSPSPGSVHPNTDGSTPPNAQERSDAADDDNWVDAFPEEQRASASDPEGIKRMLAKDVSRLFPVDEERILIAPDGSEVREPPLFDPAMLRANEPVFVENRTDGDVDFDYVLVAMENTAADGVPLIATCLMRDGLIVPSQYSTYGDAQRPPRYPFLTVEEAKQVVASEEPSVDAEPSRIFYRSPVSPSPLLFVYEFVDGNRALYVSQDGVLWRSLAEMERPFG